MRAVVTITIAAVLPLVACSGEGGEPAANQASADFTEDGPPHDNGNQPPGRANMGAPMTGDEALGSDAVMQGEWVAKTMAGAPAALFGPPQSEASFSVRCDGSELVFVRSTLVEDGGTIEMALMAGGETRRIDASAKQNPVPQVIGRLPASDPFTEVLAGTREPIAVAVAQGSSFRMPSSPQMRKVVADCRA